MLSMGSVWAKKTVDIMIINKIVVGISDRSEWSNLHRGKQGTFSIEIIKAASEESKYCQHFS